MLLEHTERKELTQSGKWKPQEQSLPFECAKSSINKKMKFNALSKIVSTRPSHLKHPLNPFVNNNPFLNSLRTMGPSTVAFNLHSSAPVLMQWTVKERDPLKLKMR